MQSPGYYCLDYRKNGQLICQSEAQRALLAQWMNQALYTRNYSPLPMAALDGAQVDHVIGLAVQEKYAAPRALDAAGIPPAPSAVRPVLHPP